MVVNPTFPRIAVSRNQESGHSELVIHHVQYNDAGKYSCKATQNNTKEAVDYFTLHFTLTVIG